MSSLERNQMLLHFKVFSSSLFHFKNFKCHDEWMSMKRRNLKMFKHLRLKNDWGREKDWDVANEREKYSIIASSSSFSSWKIEWIKFLTSPSAPPSNTYSIHIEDIFLLHFLLWRGWWELIMISDFQSI